MFFSLPQGLGCGVLAFRVLGWAVVFRVISPPTWVISIVILLITLLIATHEPPSKRKAEDRCFRV